mmetsp:Transcript_11280/g.37345  ORF Transcript_11280/g.37345 Transcript_11280/m.37345 type:complete len:417 (+) Transcript_11280:249-1499(+)
MGMMGGPGGQPAAVIAWDGGRSWATHLVCRQRRARSFHNLDGAWAPHGSSMHRRWGGFRRLFAHADTNNGGRDCQAAKRTGGWERMGGMGARCGPACGGSRRIRVGGWRQGVRVRWAPTREPSAGGGACLQALLVSERPRGCVERGQRRRRASRLAHPPLHLLEVCHRPVPRADGGALCGGEPERQSRERRRGRDTGGEHKDAMPAGPLLQHAEGQPGHRAAHLGYALDEAAGRRRQVGRRDLAREEPEQHVNWEGAKADPGVGGLEGEPVGQGEDGQQRRRQQGRANAHHRPAPAGEDAVRRGARNQRADKAARLHCKQAAGRGVHWHALGLVQEDSGPVGEACPDQRDAEVGHRHQPQLAVEQHVPAERAHQPSGAELGLGAGLARGARLVLAGVAGLDGGGRAEEQQRQHARH